MAVDSSGNLYVADAGNNRIRKITPKREVTTLAGTGTAGFADTGTDADGNPVVAQFNGPSGVAVDSDGNVYVADSSNHRIRKITSKAGGITVSTLAGTGTAGSANHPSDPTLARFNYPYGVAVNSSGNVYVADIDNNCIRRITPAGG